MKCNVENICGSYDQAGGLCWFRWHQLVERMPEDARRVIRSETMILDSLTLVSVMKVPSLARDLRKNVWKDKNGEGDKFLRLHCSQRGRGGALYPEIDRDQLACDCYSDGGPMSGKLRDKQLPKTPVSTL